MSIFKLETLLVGEQFKMCNYPQTPLAVFNPGAYISKSKLVVIPRLVFDIRFYASSIGLCEPLEFSKLREYHKGAKNIKTNLLKYPTNHYELEGVEDPRINEEGDTILTVGIVRNQAGKMEGQTALHNFNGRDITSSKPFLFRDSIHRTGRDAVIINDHVLLFRPEAEPLRTYRAFYTETEDNIVIKNKGLKPLIELDAHPGERKRGMSTNSLKIGENQHIIGWHVVYSDKVEYKEGFMIFNDEGEVLGKTPMVLEVSGLLRYGHRPFTLFGCGLVRVKDVLYFVGGIGDSWIGIFSAKSNDVLGGIR